MSVKTKSIREKTCLLELGNQIKQKVRDTMERETWNSIKDA